MQKTAYEMRISDWSSDVCSSDLSRTCVAPSVPKVAVRLRCTALRPAWAAAATSVAGIQTQVQSMAILSLLGLFTRAGRYRQPGRRSWRPVAAGCDGTRHADEIGRAEGRERVCQYG